MFMEVGAQHHIPHFHAYYQEDVGIFSIDPVEMIAGFVTKTAKKIGRSLGRIASARIDDGLGDLATRKDTGSH